MSALAQTFPAAALHVLGPAREIAELACYAASVSSAGSINDPMLGPFFASGAELPVGSGEVFRGADLVVSFLNDPERIFESNVRACGARQFLRGPCRIDERGRAAAEQLAAPLRQSGIVIDLFAPRLRFNSEEIRLAKSECGEPLIALHPGSGSRKKNWPIQNWLELTQRLHEHTERIVVGGGEADRAELHTFQTQFPSLAYAVDWPLRKLAALFAGVQLFLGHDSGVSHLAAASGAASVLLFGPTNPAIWAAGGDNVHVLRAPGGDLNRMTVSEVFGAIVPTL